MRTSHPNIAMIATVARNLGDLRGDVVFVGGATVSLFVTEPGAPEPRATGDVDVVVEVASRARYHAFTEKLRERGFREDVESTVLCRFRVEGIAVDVMPTLPEILGFSNRWYEATLGFSQILELEADLMIRLASHVFSPPKSKRF